MYCMASILRTPTMKKAAMEYGTSAMPRVTASSSVRERTRDWMPMSRNFFSKARAGTMMESMPLPVPMVMR